MRRTAVFSILLRFCHYLKISNFLTSSSSYISHISISIDSSKATTGQTLVMSGHNALGSKSDATKYLIELAKQGFHVSKRGNVMSLGGLVADDVLHCYGNEKLKGATKEKFLKMTKDKQWAYIGRAMTATRSYHGADGSKGGFTAVDGGKVCGMKKADFNALSPEEQANVRSQFNSRRRERDQQKRLSAIDEAGANTGSYDSSLSAVDNIMNMFAHSGIDPPSFLNTDVPVEVRFPFAFSCFYISTVSLVGLHSPHVTACLPNYFLYKAGRFQARGGQASGGHQVQEHVRHARCYRACKAGQCG